MFFYSDFYITAHHFVVYLTKTMYDRLSVREPYCQIMSHLKSGPTHSQLHIKGNCYGNEAWGAGDSGWTNVDLLITHEENTQTHTFEVAQHIAQYTHRQLYIYTNTTYHNSLLLFVFMLLFIDQLLSCINTTIYLHTHPTIYEWMYLHEYVNLFKDDKDGKQYKMKWSAYVAYGCSTHYMQE